MTIKKDLKASGTDLGTESVNVQENAAQVLYSKILVCIVNTKVEEGVEKLEEVEEEVEAEMSESVASGIDQVRERFFLIYIENSVCLPGSINSRLSCNVFSELFLMFICILPKSNMLNPSISFFCQFISVAGC